MIKKEQELKIVNELMQQDVYMLEWLKEMSEIKGSDISKRIAKIEIHMHILEHMKIWLTTP